MSALPGAIASAFLLLLLFFSAGQVSLSQSSLALAERQALLQAGDISRTALAITTMTLAGTTVTASVKNSGSLSIHQWSRMDVIVEYRQPSGPRYQRLTYSPSGGAGTWRQTSISPDTHDPGIWNPGETAVLETQLPSAAQNGTQLRLIVGAPTGVTTSGTLTVP